MSYYLRMLAFLGLFHFFFVFVSAVAQEAAKPVSGSTTETPKDSPNSAKQADSNAGQDDLDAAMELKTTAKDIEKNTKVIELIEKAIIKGLPKEDLPLAKELLASSALERAKIQLQEMIKSPVSDTMARRVQRLVLSDLELAVKNDATLGEAYLLMAQVSMRTDAEKAKTSLDKAIEQLGHDTDKRGIAYAQRAQLKKDADAKLADLKLALEDLPSSSVQSIEVQRQMFELLIGKGRFDDVYELGASLMKENKKNPLAVQATIAALSKLDRNDEAIKILDERIEAEPGNLGMLAMRANVYLTTGKHEDAIADATTMIEKKPDGFEGFLLRAKVYLRLAAIAKEGKDSAELTNARRDIESALEVEPKSLEGVYLRFQVSSAQKRYDEAIQDVTRLAKNDPQQPDFLLQLAMLYQLNDQPSMAVKFTDKLILLDKTNGLAYRTRGDAKLSIGDQAGAAADYKKALEFLKNKEEERSGLLNNLAWILATSPEDSLRDGKQAIKLGKEACELTEYKEAHILSTLAACYAETGDFEEAIKWSTKAVELGAKDAHEQLEQLEKELKSYQESKPWREKQEVKENKAPVIKPENTIET